MMSARPVTAASGKPPARPLAVVIRSGIESFVLTGEPRSGAGDPGLDLVGDQQDAAIAAEVGHSP